MGKILITGASGLIGSEFRARLSADEAYFAGHRDCDVTSLENIMTYAGDKDISVIINCAASRDAEYLEDNPESGLAINVQAPKNLAVAANKLGAALIHISSDYVFDGSRNTPYRETDQVGALSVYGRQKIEGDKAVLEIAETAVVLRTAWVFSSYGKDFVKIIGRLAQSRDEINVIYDQVGSPAYAADFAAAVLCMLPRIKTGSREIYNLTNEGVCSWYDMAVQIVDLFGYDCRVNPIETKDFSQRAPRPKYSVLSKDKIKRDFGLSLRHYSAGLRDCVNLIKGAPNAS
ncbi:MAG: dTDP-4-dehydrorhamnose reductase [Proteobacteria bacterium]|nr:dTDP-4-dehydrorhamnose reductase [Pseudomonadota bacterium]